MTNFNWIRERERSQCSIREYLRPIQKLFGQQRSNGRFHLLVSVDPSGPERR